MIKEIKKFLLTYKYSPWRVTVRTSSEMMNTREGREELHEMLGRLRPPPRSIPMDVCPQCQGYGKLGHTEGMEDGSIVNRVENKLCPSCGATGLLGYRVDGTLVPLPYRNIHCKVCGGIGVHNSQACTTCNRTGIVKELIENTNKEQEKEKQNG